MQTWLRALRSLAFGREGRGGSHVVDDSTRTLLAVALIACLSRHRVGTATTTSTETKKFEVIAVEGNQLVVRLPEGTREITVANDFRFTVDGQPLSVQQLKPGMAGTATITTTTKSTPVTVTEVKNGTVVHVRRRRASSSAPMRGSRSFTQGDIDKRGVKIYRAGKPALVSRTSAPATAERRHRHVDAAAGRQPAGSERHRWRRAGRCGRGCRGGARTGWCVGGLVGECLGRRGVASAQ